MRQHVCSVKKKCMTDDSVWKHSGNQFINKIFIIGLTPDFCQEREQLNARDSVSVIFVSLIMLIS